MLTALLMGFCCLFYAPEAFSQEESSALPKQSGLDEDMAKCVALAKQRYGEQLRNQYMVGATTAKEYAIGALRMENDIAKAEGEGNTELANMLRQQLAAVQQANQISNTDLKQKAMVGPRNTRRRFSVPMRRF